MSDGASYEHVYTGPSLEKVFAMAAAAKAGAYNRLIYDDTAAAVPEEQDAGYDLDTCDRKHSRMTAYQAQRIDQLGFALETATGEIAHLRALGAAMDERVARLEQTIRDWSAGR